MNIELEITTSEDYAQMLGKEIDWEETGNKEMISVDEADSIQSILACEVAIWLMRRSTGSCGSVSERMITMRRECIKKHNESYTKYDEEQDFY